jgi:hypothetical protein
MGYVHLHPPVDDIVNATLAVETNNAVHAFFVSTDSGNEAILWAPIA